MTDDQHDPLEAFADDRLALAQKIHEQNRDAEPNEDNSESDEGRQEDVARECGCSVSLVSDILLSAIERGLVMTPAGIKRASVSDEEKKFRELTSKLIKILDYTKPPERPGNDEFDVLSTMRVRRYAALHAFDVPQFDAMNGHLNMQQFASTVKVLKWNYVKGKLKKTEHPLTKAAVNNAVLDAQKHFGLPPRKDQREEETRELQSAVRNGQLKKS